MTNPRIYKTQFVTVIHAIFDALRERVFYGIVLHFDSSYHCSLNGAEGDTLNIALPNMDLPEPPAPKLLTTFQRELNRATDSDRNTRKRGLQKLLEDVPWPKKSQREDLKVFVYQHLWKVIVPIVSDDVEKCRELSLQILKRCLEKCDDISIDLLQEIVVRLCARIGELPFPEPAEEIRLLVVELMLMISRHAAFTASIVTNGAAVSSIDEMIVQALARGLTDAFPPVKRAGAELLVEIAARSPFTVRSHFKQVLKALQTNAGHQHSKTRSITLQAIGKGLACLGLEDHQTLFKEPILATFLRTVSDRTASVRIELGVVAAEIFEHRIKQCLDRGCALLAEDFELIVIILLLHGDTIEEVSAEGRCQLIRAVHLWDPVLLSNDGEVDVPINSHLNASTAMDVSDGELALQQHSNTATTETSASSEPKSATVDYNDVSKVRQFAAANMRSILPILQEGVESWTTDSRKRYLCGLDCFISYVDGSINAVLPRLFSIIALQVRDEDAEVRAAAEQCCVRLGFQASGEDMLEILLPRVAGAVAGGDTAAQRASAAGVLTHVLKGLRQRVDSVASSADSLLSVQMPNMLYLCTTLATTLSETPLYGFREASLRESVLLLVRTLMECFPAECKESAHIQQAVLLALTFLCGKCPGEDDVIPDIAHKVLERLSDIVDVTVDALLGLHYQFLLYHIVTFQLPTSVTSVVKIDVADVKNSPAMAHFYGELSLQWESDSVAMAAFNALVRSAPEATWKNFGLILPVVKKMVQPRAAPVAGSAEANALTYAAQRGESLVKCATLSMDVVFLLLARLFGHFFFSSFPQP